LILTKAALCRCVLRNTRTASQSLPSIYVSAVELNSHLVRHPEAGGAATLLLTKASRGECARVMLLIAYYLFSWNYFRLEGGVIYGPLEADTPKLFI
jgi:hypothetical protein